MTGNLDKKMAEPVGAGGSCGGLLECNRDNRLFFSFFLVCFFVAVTYLSLDRSLCETLEAESALIAQQYLHGSSLLLNHMNGAVDLDKPPGYYWLIALVAWICPSWELAARIPSILSVALVLFLFYKVALQRGEPGLFHLWGLIYASSPKIFWMSQVARMDLAFSACCFGAVYHLIRALGTLEDKIELDSKEHMAAFFVLAAASVLIKGPLGAILLFFPLVIYLLIAKKWIVLRRIFLGRYILLFLILALPWFVYATVATDLRFFSRFFLEENLSRFTSLLPGGGFKEFNHSPWTRYFVYLFTGAYPWSLIIPLWVWDVVVKWKKKRQLERLFFIYFAFIFIFFTLAVSKRSDYILPLYPFVAFFTARFILTRDLFRYFRIISLAALGPLSIVLAFLSGFGLFLVVHHHIVPGHLSSMIRMNQSLLHFFINNLDRDLTLLVVLFVMASLGVAFSVFKPWNGGDWIRLALGYQLIIGMVVLGLGLKILPGIYEGKDVRPFCHHVIKLVGNKPLYYLGYWDEQCTFYLKRRVERLTFLQIDSMHIERPTFFIADRDRYHEALQRGLAVACLYTDHNLVLQPRFLLIIPRKRPGQGLCP